MSIFFSAFHIIMPLYKFRDQIFHSYIALVFTIGHVNLLSLQRLCLRILLYSESPGLCPQHVSFETKIHFIKTISKTAG